MSKTKTATALLCALGLAGVAGCDVNEGPEGEFQEAGEEAGEAVEATIDTARDKVEEAGDKLEEATDEAT